MDESTLLSDERLFTRDIDGYLLRMDKPTHDMLDDVWVNLTVDGKEVKVPKAVPLTDAEGGIRYDEKYRPIPRLTTILDAVGASYDPKPNPVPVLCYREHMTPAAVCRVCMVQVAQRDRKTGAVLPDSKLYPACHQPVVEGMIVETIDAKEPNEAGELVITVGAKRVRKTITTLIEMLAADHLHPGAHPANELEALTRRLNLDPDHLQFERHERFESGPTALDRSSPDGRQAGRMHDESSVWFTIDRTACILCDRCVRGCGEVRGHFVLARAGKGANARIAFDWDQPMGDPDLKKDGVGSNCVKCGECFISCPTNAITMKPDAKKSPWDYEREHALREANASPMGWLARLFRRKDGRG